MGVTETNPGALAELTRKVRSLQGAGFKTELAQILAAEALHQVEEGFLAERDPSGRPWARFSKNTRRRRGSMSAAKLLRDTGRMFNSRAAAPTAGGFRLSLTAEYAAAHQYGTKTIPRRQMVPEKDTGGLGPIWLEAFNREADSLMRRRMGKAA
jgi:phage virion morphogenesis protein